MELKIHVECSMSDDTILRLVDEANREESKDVMRVINNITRMTPTEKVFVVSNALKNLVKDKDNAQAGLTDLVDIAIKGKYSQDNNESEADDDSDNEMKLYPQNDPRDI